MSFLTLLFYLTGKWLFFFVEQRNCVDIDLGIEINMFMHVCVCVCNRKKMKEKSDLSWTFTERCSKSHFCLVNHRKVVGYKDIHNDLISGILRVQNKEVICILATDSQVLVRILHFGIAMITF